MYETLARYIRTLEYVPLSPLGVSTETLRWRLEEDGFPISLRSVQRDLVKLAGWFPIAERPVRKGARARHWSWVGRTPLGIRSLGPLTAVSLVMGERLLQGLVPERVLIHTADHVRRAWQVLAAQGFDQIRRWPDKVRVVAHGPEIQAASVDGWVREVVYEALLQDRRLRIHYRVPGEPELQVEDVDPLGLIHQHTVTHLVCRVVGEATATHIPLHRIQSVEMPGAPAEPVQGFELDAYLASGALAGSVGARTVRLQARVSAAVAEEIAETPLGSGQQLACAEDGSWLLETRVRDDRDLRRWLLGLGDEVEVLAPRALREGLADTCARASERYRRAGLSRDEDAGFRARQRPGGAAASGAETPP